MKSLRWEYNREILERQRRMCYLLYNNDDHLDIVLQDSWELWRTPLTVPAAGFVMMVIHRNT